jgi:hypothetical protein
MEQFNLLEHLDTSIERLGVLYKTNPNFRAIVDGYNGEDHFRPLIQGIAGVENIRKPGDQNRNEKGDVKFGYKGFPISIEIKSIAKNTVKKNLFGWSGKAAVKSSDKKQLVFSDGSVADVAMLPRGQFTVLAVGCHAFTGNWKDFQYCLNSELPKPTSSDGLTDLQKNELISVLVPVEWPPVGPFTTNLEEILERAVAEQKENLRISPEVS